MEIMCVHPLIQRNANVRCAATAMAAARPQWLTTRSATMIATASPVPDLLLAAGVGAAHGGPRGRDTRQSDGCRAKPSVTAENNMNNVHTISIDI